MYDYTYYDYGYDYGYDVGGAATGLAAFGVGLLVFWLISMAIVAFNIIVMWKVFKKAGKPGWAALIPIYNIIVMIEIAELPMWYIALYFVPGANIYAMIKINIEMAHKFGKSTGFGVGMALLQPVFYAILAFSKNTVFGGIQNSVHPVQPQVQPMYQQTVQETVAPVQPVVPTVQEQPTPVVVPVMPVQQEVTQVVEPIMSTPQVQPVYQQPVQETVAPVQPVIPTVQEQVVSEVVTPAVPEVTPIEQPTELVQEQPVSNQPTPAFCTNCGSALMPNAKFCTNCGKQL